MKIVFLFAILANLIALVANISLTAYCIALHAVRCAVLHGVITAFCFGSLAICLLALDDYIKSESYGQLFNFKR